MVFTKRTLLVFLAVSLLAQFLQPDRTAPTSLPGSDLIALTMPRDSVAGLLRAACYDCHSNSTTYPWYSYITPVNFWLERHVDEGRDELNLSEWGAHKEKWQRHKAREAVEMLQDGSMPPDSYTLLHGEARLDEAERRELIALFEELR